MQNVTPVAVAVLVAELVPAALFGFAPQWPPRLVQRWPARARTLLPALFGLPYAFLAGWLHIFQWNWFALYALLPVGMAWLLGQAARVDPEQKGNWRDGLILLTLGLAVDLRWFDSGWPAGWESLGKLLLVNAGLYGFLAIRQLSGTGFDFKLKLRDWTSGLRELLFFAPLVLGFGFALGFLHLHAARPSLGTAFLRWMAIFFFVAVPEELFFRGWVQNLLERRLGRTLALIVASILFGLSHFNKRNPVAVHFNWRYVLLATLAGIFYGRAWRDHRRVPASTITHTFVDWIWSWWF
ncbi:MAG TPA: CPBP family intramembrane glutamic endopeptidase [Verrucomicrobiae bacterium]|nr:CPBP family intramembrane glutamic endopeptidase [Verrucomicrobiae bacterium]